MSGRGRNGYGEVGTPFEKGKNPLIKRETLELLRAYDMIDEKRVRKSIFATVKAPGESSHAKHLAGAANDSLHGNACTAENLILGLLRPIHAKSGDRFCAKALPRL